MHSTSFVKTSQIISLEKGGSSLSGREAWVQSRFDSSHNPPGAVVEEGIAAGGVMDVETALQEVLKTAVIHDDSGRGMEAAKALV